MSKTPFVMALAFLSACFADTLTLKGGRTVNGTYLGGTAREIRMEVGDRIETFQVSEVSGLQFGGSTAARPEGFRTSAPRQEGILRPETSAPAPAPRGAGIELPAGTVFAVRMIDGVDSSRNSVGDTFQASMDEPVMVNGEPVIPRGADVVVKLVDDKESGKLTGRTELTLDLMSVKVNGRVVDINTQSVTRASESRGARTGKVVGGTAALGAVIGAIAGGGKGAAVGAASGAGVGAAAQAVTHGQRVRIPSETRLTFQLETPVRI